MIYRHSFILYKMVALAMAGYGFILKGTLHPTADGAEAIMVDPMTDTVYRISMERIQTQVIPGTVDELIKKGGL